MDVLGHQDVRGEGEMRERESIFGYVANTIILCKLEFLCACSSEFGLRVLREGVNVSLVLPRDAK